MTRLVSEHFKTSGQPKLAFTSKADAQAYIEEHSHGEHLAAYRCSFCGAWHMASRHGIPGASKR